MNVQNLPVVNASLNASATVLIIAGLIAIKANKPRLHRALMFGAIAVSAAFLTCYLIYHFNVVAVTKFTHDGWPRTVYYFILLTHIPLAILVLPLLAMTVWRAIQGRYEAHKKWAKITAPVWLYVSVTGVLVYLMLYVWYRPVVS
jgi:putative membrane protein